jgi:hypothetical protein
MESVAVAVSVTVVTNVWADEIESVAVADSAIAETYVGVEEIASVAVDVSVTGALNVLAATASESVAAAVSVMLALNVELPSDENGACENEDRPNTRHAPLISGYCQFFFSEPTLLHLAVNICPLNQVRYIAIFIHAHSNHWALWHNAR